MSGVLDLLALLLTAAGVLAAAAVLVRGPKSARLALGVGLDLWLAAGLLRLTASVEGTRLATAAAVVLIRQLVVRGLSHPALQRLH